MSTPSPEPIELIPAHQVVLDLSLQMRAEDTDSAFLDTLGDAIAAGAKMPPIIAFREDATDAKGNPCPSYYIGDGWHRFFAHREKYRLIPAIIRDGGRDAAFAYALGANYDQQAKPRTRKDIRKAVIAAVQAYISGPDAAKNTAFLRKYTFSNGSGVSISGSKKVATQQEIASICRTTQKTVSNIIRDLEKEQSAVVEPPVTEVRTGADGKQYTAVVGQLSFLDRLFHEVEPMAQIHNTFIKHGVWIDDSIPIEDRLKGVQTWKDAMRRMLKDIAELETALLKAKQNG